MKGKGPSEKGKKYEQQQKDLKDAVLHTCVGDRGVACNVV